MRLILISGQLFAAKDTAADYLVKSLNSKVKYVEDLWKRSAFANAVKITFETAFNVNRGFIEKWKRIPEPPPGMLKPIRQALQFIGDGFRQIDPDIWIKIALSDESAALAISDGRYLSEGCYVKSKNGINVVLYRPNFLNNDPNPSESQIKPIVEWCAKTQKDGPINLNFSDKPEGIEYYDFFLNNDGTLENLYQKTDDLLIPYVEAKYDMLIPK